MVPSAIELVKNARAGGADALIETLDAILLVFIFVELLYAVRISQKPSACARRLISVARFSCRACSGVPGSVSSGVVSQRSASSSS